MGEIKREFTFYKGKKIDLDTTEKLLKDYIREYYEFETRIDIEKCNEDSLIVHIFIDNYYGESFKNVLFCNAVDEIRYYFDDSTNSMSENCHIHFRRGGEEKMFKYGKNGYSFLILDNDHLCAALWFLDSIDDFEEAE